ncbi:MAG: oligosaccharide flippase family protein, partial [Proteobacteria bacterium]|nr:oligosaccharide flippase family protein [Pseudomonadota bacterium]
MNFRKTVIVSGGLLAQQATVFATGVVIARHLGAGGYGTLGILKSLSSVLVIITPLGLDLALLKHASFYYERPAELLTMSRALRLGVGAMNVLLLIIVILWFGPVLQGIYGSISDFAPLSAITMLGVVFATDVQISGALYRVSDRIISYSVIVNYLQPCLRMAVSLAVVAANGGVAALTWVNAVMFVFAFLAIAVDERRFRAQALPMPASVVLRKAREILSESLWMATSLLVYQALRLVDVLVLAALTTAQITGEYAAMSSVAQLIQIYPMAMSQTLGPRIALLYRQGDMFAIMLELRSYLRRASMLGGYLFGGVAVFGADLDLIFGKSFSFSGP